jgi:hypothetical protein
MDSGVGDELGIHRIDSSSGEADAQADAMGEYDGPALVPCTQSSFTGVSIPPLPDGGPPDGGYAGTTGQTCQSNADCNGNFCNLNYPSPICEVPPSGTGSNCDPGSDGLIHGCDAPPDAGNAPGLCLPIGPAQGLCVQPCTFAPGGTAAQGCTGNNACNNVELFAQVNGSSAPIGLGFCGGGCSSDSDCLGPYNHCVIELGLCSSTAVGATLNGPCNCVPNNAGGTSGFCAQACVVSPTSHCPAGTVCDALEPTMVPTGTGTVPGFMSQNFGLTGWCIPQCQNGVCPSVATCSDVTAAGMDCQPL